MGQGLNFYMINVKCTDCGLSWQNASSIKDIGILDGNNCPNCGGEVIFIDEVATRQK
jgi:DNA-directed RNA polymerase subunit RPC12/RpoP